MARYKVQLVKYVPMYINVIVAITPGRHDLATEDAAVTKALEVAGPFGNGIADWRVDHEAEYDVEYDDGGVEPVPDDTPVTVPRGKDWPTTEESSGAR